MYKLFTIKNDTWRVEILYVSDHCIQLSKRFWRYVEMKFEVNIDNINLHERLIYKHDKYFIRRYAQLLIILFYYCFTIE